MTNLLYLKTPVHPVTITVVGVGGTGSMLLTRLARLDFALQNLNHPGIYVNVYDPDTVEHNNIGRQNFTEYDIGINKAYALTSKINVAFNLDWQAFPKEHTGKLDSNILITCVDNVDFRKKVHDNVNSLKLKKNVEPYEFPYLWIDTGNGKDFGQVVVKNIFDATSKSPFDLFDYDLSNNNEIQGISGCSYADSLAAQDLFINDLVSVYTSHILFSLLYRGEYNPGAVMNLSKLKTNPL